MIKAVLFDLDGTLADSLLDLATSADYALGNLGYKGHTLKEYQYFVGNGIPKLIERSLPENARDTQTVQKCLQIFMPYYKEHCDDKTYAYDGMPELVASLKKLGYKTAVITNKAQEMAEKVVLRLIGDSFDIVCGKREGYPAKPDPKLTLEVMSELGVKPEECVFVGDSQTDMATAINSGALPIGVLWGYRTKSEIEKSGAKFIVSNAEEIIQILNNL
ncbi:MAG: HAD-IIIA family hydrolase [Clostridia bacterium]|nr:HAD-IIIA family hydrolase [Clostridia bacterium]